jgi:hypothetical protein
MEMSVKTFHRHFYFPTFLPENKNVYGKFSLTFVRRNLGNKNVCGNVYENFLKTFFFPHSFLKIITSMEMPMETFHRHLWQGIWENKNV